MAVEEVSSIFENVVQSLKDFTLSLVKPEVNDDVLTVLKSFFEGLEGPFDHLCSEYKRMKFLEEKANFVKPEKHLIGTERKIRRNGRKVSIVGVDVNVEVVSIKKNSKAAV